MTGTGFAAAAPRAAFLLPKRTLFLLALFLSVFMPAAAGLMWQPYTGKGPPGTYVVDVPVDPSLDFPAKDQSRLPQIPVRTVAYRFDPPVQKASTHEAHERVTLPWSCDTIREAVSGLTRKQQERLARVVRLTDEQRVAAKRCLKEKRT
jgi:hypothetical protein